MRPVRGASFYRRTLPADSYWPIADSRQPIAEEGWDMVFLSRIYTKSGDRGETGLGDGTRVPKDHPRVAAWCHFARTACRAAERDVVALAARERVNPQAVIYLNRLSDLLFVLARVYNDNGRADVLWQPGKTQRPGP